LKRIRLRPYHPTYIVAHYGGGVSEESRARVGFEAIQRTIRDTPLAEIEVEIVREHDDACEGCIFRWETEEGSIWGSRHSCTSAEDPQIIARVDRTSAKVFRLLGVDYGSVIPFRELVSRLREKIPALDDKTLGGPGLQESYEKGLAALTVRA